MNWGKLLSSIPIVMILEKEQPLMAYTSSNIIAAATSNLNVHLTNENVGQTYNPRSPTPRDIPESSTTQQSSARPTRARRSSASPRFLAGANSKKRFFSQVNASPSRHGFPHASLVHHQQTNINRTQLRGTRPPRPVGIAAQGTSHDFPTDPTSFP